MMESEIKRRLDFLSALERALEGPFIYGLPAHHVLGATVARNSFQ